MGTARASLASDWSCGCTAQCGAVLLAAPLHGHNIEASSIPGRPVTLHTCPIEHSQDPAAPLTQPTVSSGTLWHLSPIPAASLGTPHCLQLWLPAVPIMCCSWGRALGIAPLLPLTQCQLLAPQLPLHSWGQSQLLEPGLASRQQETVFPST